MAVTNFFVTANYLKSLGFINKNVDELLYMNLVEGVSKSFLRKQIGTHFFNDLLIKYNLATLSTDEEIIVDYMQFAIGYRLKATAGVEFTYQLTNKGYQKQAGDNQESLDLSEVGFRTDKILQLAIQQELELAEYLCQNKDLYPEFISELNRDSSIKKHCNGCCNGTDGYAEGQSLFII